MITLLPSASRSAATALLALALGACSHGSGDTSAALVTRWEPPVELGTTNGDAAVAMSESGETLIVWGRARAMLSRSRFSNGNWGSEEKAIDMPEGGSVSAVTLRADRAAGVVYQKGAYGTGLGGPQVLISSTRRTPAGAWSSPKSALGVALPSLREQVTTSNPKGDLLATVLVTPDQLGGTGLEAVRNDASSDTWSSLYLFPGGWATRAQATSGCLAPDSTFLVTWCENRPSPTWTVVARWGEGLPEEPNYPLAVLDDEPLVTAAALEQAWGAVVLVGTAAGKVWAVRFANGPGWLPPELLATSSTRITDLRAAMDASGNALAAWRQTEDGADAIVGRAYRVDRGAWLDAVTIAPTGSQASRWELAGCSDGSAYLAWVAADAGAQELLVRRKTPSGTWQEAQLLQRAPPGYTLSAPRLAVDATGRASAVWIRAIGSAFDLVSASTR